MSKKENIFVKSIEQIMSKKQSPAVLTGLTIAGIVLTGVTAYRAGLKAHDIIKERKEEKKLLEKDIRDSELDKREARGLKKDYVVETIKKTAPVVAPPVIVGGVTAVCAISSNVVSSKRIAALSAAYAIARDTISDTNNKMIELLGDKKAKQIKDEVARSKAKKLPNNEDDFIECTGKGNMIFIDTNTGVKFRSNLNAVRYAINEASSLCMAEVYIQLNDFYHFLGLDCIKLGEIVGWSTNSIAGGTLPISLTTSIDDFYGEVVTYIDYDIEVSSRVMRFDEYM